MYKIPTTGKTTRAQLYEYTSKEVSHMSKNKKNQAQDNAQITNENNKAGNRANNNQNANDQSQSGNKADNSRNR